MAWWGGGGRITTAPEDAFGGLGAEVGRGVGVQWSDAERDFRVERGVCGNGLCGVCGGPGAMGAVGGGVVGWWGGAWCNTRKFGKG